MVTVIFLSAVILLTTLFCVKPKKLHLFEILAVWLTVIILGAPGYSFFLVNQHWISVPDNREFALVRIVYTLWLVPLCAVWFFDWWTARRTLIVKVLFLAAAIPVFASGGWLLDRWGIVYYHGPGRAAYFADRALLLLLSACVVLLIRQLMRKDGLRI